MFIDKLTDESQLLIPNLYIRYWHEGKPTEYFIGPTNNGVYSMKSNKLLTPSIKPNGYVEYHLYIDGIKVTKTYNNLIGLTALPNDDPIHKTEVDHLYGNKLDNDYRSLEWVSHGENNRRARKYGQNPPLYGERNGCCKYGIEILSECNYLLRIGYTINDVHEMTTVPKSMLYKLINGGRKDITKGKPFPDTVYSHVQRNKRASKDVIDKVLKLRDKGIKAGDISKILNIPKQQVYNIYYYKR